MLLTGNALPIEVLSRATSNVIADIELKATKNLHPGLKLVFSTAFCS